MSAPQRLRPEPAAQANPAATTDPAASALPEGFRAGPGEDRLPGLVGYALAIEAGLPAGAEDPPARRAEADRLLQDWAFRHLHNHLERIRADAAREALAGQRRPAGFLTMLGAVLAGLILSAGLVWLALHLGVLPPFGRP